MVTVTKEDRSTQTTISVQQQSSQTSEMAKDAVAQSDTAEHSTTLDIGAELSNLIDRLQEEAPTRETLDSDLPRGEGL